MWSPMWDLKCLALDHRGSVVRTNTLLMGFYQVDLIEQHWRRTIKREIYNHRTSKNTQLPHQYNLNSTDQGEKALCSIWDFHLWKNSISAILSRSYLVPLRLILSSVSQHIEFKSGKATPSFTRVDRASGRICHTSAREPHLCFDSPPWKKEFIFSIVS